MAITDKDLITLASEDKDTGTDFNLPRTLGENEEEYNKRVEDYKNKVNEKFHLEYPNLNIVDSIHDKETGLDAIVVQDINTKEVAIIFPASAGFSGLGDNDWLEANLPNGVGEVPTQFKDALDYANQIKLKYNLVAVSGNSLGGGLAQFVGSSSPDIRVRTLNPSGINQAMINYLTEKNTYFENGNIINMYSTTDMLHLALGLQEGEEVNASGIISPTMVQMGKNVLYLFEGDYSIEHIPDGHTGQSNVLTLHGPFDPLTGELLEPSLVKETTTGRYYYQATTNKEISLDVESLTTLACNLSKSLDGHADGIFNSLNNLSKIIEDSFIGIDDRKVGLMEALDYTVLNNSKLVNALYSGDGLITLISEMSNVDILKSNVLTTLVVSVDLYVKAHLDIRGKIERAIEEFLGNCGITAIEKYKPLEDVITPFGTIYSPNIMIKYYENNYINAPIENELGLFMNKIYSDSIKIQNALTYYNYMILLTASTFQEMDNKIASDIKGTLNQDIEKAKSSINTSGMNLSMADAINVEEKDLHLEYDSISLIGGLSSNRHTKFENNLYIFQNLIKDFLDILKDEILAVIIIAVENGYSVWKTATGAQENEVLLSFDLWSTRNENSINPNNRVNNTGSYTDTSHDTAGTYSQYVNLYNDKQKFIKEAKELIDALKRAKKLLDGMGDPQIKQLTIQFEQQILLLLFHDTKLQIVIENAQRLTANASIAAQLLAEVNNQLSHNTGLSIDKIYELGKKVQEMLEISMSHTGRISL